MGAILLGASGAVVTAVTAILGFWFGRKERNANAEATTVKTAVELNASLLVRIGKLEERTDQTDKELDKLERKERIQGRLLIQHERWDLDVVSTLRTHNIDMRPPPSLDVGDTSDPNGPRTRAEDYGLGTTQP